MKNEKSRIYIPYIQYIDMIEKLSDETAKELILKIANYCITILDIDFLAKAHEKRYRESSIIAEKEKLLEPIYNVKNKIDAMIQLAFLVNKCTKTRSIKEDEKEDIKNKDINDEIRKDFKSIDEKKRKEALKRIVKLDEEEFVQYYTYNQLEYRKEIFYEIKHKLLSAIIKELGVNEEEYKNYIYGFIRDDNSYIFAINIPEHLGTYQFHIEPNDEKDILYDIGCYEVQHEFEQWAEGNTELGKMTFLCTKEEIKDLSKLEQELKKLKIKAGKTKEISNKNEEEVFRKIFLYSILLGKNPRTELNEANSEVSFSFINENECGLSEYTSERTIEDQRKYNMIINNLRKIHKIYVASPDTLDSKVAIEALKRKLAELECEINDEDIIIVRPRNKGDRTRNLYKFK